MFRKLLVSKISGLVILLANTATTMGCTLVFHEPELPESLKKENPFN
ncbi:MULTISPECIES: cyclic lactone autoinducer peptide [Ureibacillus]|jgi:cyclic lactone autoinducer peptide|uniref:Cyclic lactone autoinducer peptide n=1 Tax=Ureibacillus thermosphaericus TaxID=51173 RepID=A0A840PWH1_URETH|nr:cyclic lactone autoinducer peptide [Ureibacillus thermosphaericus]MBB5150220.1 cyclic lactone autoinducer peptide [Ureibacillus thermosphaericus]NKZ32260.1 cyclic lactone autoinducer peptide [Ureibacillus thermosphaericus]